jgi:hypothetical protein
VTLLVLAGLDDEPQFGFGGLVLAEDPASLLHDRDDAELFVGVVVVPLAEDEFFADGGQPEPGVDFVIAADRFAGLRGGSDGDLHALMVTDRRLAVQP